jgi:hypothetical protein
MLADLSRDEVLDFSRTDCAIALAGYTGELRAGGRQTR